MDYTLLDGTDADIDVEIDYTSLKCSTTSLQLQFQRDAVVRPPTFCSDNWETAINGAKRLFWSIVGFLAKGTGAIALGEYHMEDTYPQITATLSSGCTVDFTAVVVNDSGGQAAGGNSNRALDGRNHTNDVAMAWVDA